MASALLVGVAGADTTDAPIGGGDNLLFGLDRATAADTPHWEELPPLPLLGFDKPPRPSPWDEAPNETAPAGDAESFPDDVDPITRELTSSDSCYINCYGKGGPHFGAAGSPALQRGPPTPTPSPPHRPPGGTCDDWFAISPGYTCEYLETQGCDCRGCECGGCESQECYGQSCDYG